LPFLKESATNTVLHEKQQRTHFEKGQERKSWYSNAYHFVIRRDLNTPSYREQNNNGEARSGQQQLLTL